MQGIRNQFRAKIGEAVYTSEDVGQILHSLELDLYIGKDSRNIREYVKENKLFANLQTLGIKSRRSHVKYWIPKSNLVKIIEGMKIPVSQRDFEAAAYNLGFDF
jgi:hypothetical protein